MVSPAIFRRSLKLFPIREAQAKPRRPLTRPPSAGLPAGSPLKVSTPFRLSTRTFWPSLISRDEQLPCQRSFDLSLDGTLERTGTVTRVVTCAHEVSSGGIGEFELDLADPPGAGAAGQAGSRRSASDAPPERMEDDDLVDTVEELGPEVLAHLFQHGLLHALVIRRLQTLRDIQGFGGCRCSKS